jgi:acyl-CoA synthetase (AMP-forming)/AMP-acid ligase II
MPLARSIGASWLERPDAPAFIIGDVELTYGALAERAARVAEGLAAMPRRDVGRPWMAPEGRLLAVAVGNHPTFPELFVGATLGESACAVLDPAWPPAQARAVLERLLPDLLVADTAREDLCAAAREVGVPVLGAGTTGGYADWLEWWPAANPESRLVSGPDAATFLVGFTSGSTGVPKAFRQPRRSWRTSLTRGRAVWDLGPESHMLAPGPLSHGLTLYALAECLDAGSTFYALPKFQAGSLADVLATRDVRRLVVVPTMLRGLCRAAAASGRTFTHVEAVVSGGAKLDQSLVEDATAILPGTNISEYYGASELGFVAVSADRRAGDNGSVGLPFPGVEISIRDEHGRRVEDGTPGTVFVRSPFVCDGYVWADDDRGLHRDGEWATVGDVGWLGWDGALGLAGRRGGMIITGGFNVYPEEAETALRALDGIEETVVVGVPDAYLGTAVVAVVSGPGAEAVTLAQVAAACAVRLPRYKVPRRVYAIRQWPLTGSGKIIRREVERWIATGDGRIVELAAS